MTVIRCGLLVSKIACLKRKNIGYETDGMIDWEESTIQRVDSYKN